MAADILLYRAEQVPVGDDQLQHLELARVIARRWNAQFGGGTDFLPEPQSLLTPARRILGLDGQAKMSKSLGNTIGILDDPEEVWQKLRPAMTDPARKTKKDPGNPDVCNVYTLHKHFSPPDTVVEVAREVPRRGVGLPRLQAGAGGQHVRRARPDPGARGGAARRRGRGARGARRGRRAGAGRRAGHARRGEGADGVPAGRRAGGALTAGRTLAAPVRGARGPMEKIIKAAVERGASDLHIKAGDVFRARINGRLVPLTKQRLTPDQTRAIAHKLIPSEEDRAHLERLRDFDCSWGMPGVGRFRVNVLRQRSSFMIVMRVIPFAVPSIESLGLPRRDLDAGRLRARPAAGGGRQRERQDEHGGGHHRAHQPHQAEARRHHREPDRVPAPGHQLLRDAARGGGGHREHAPSGSGPRCGRIPT